MPVDRARQMWRLFQNLIGNAVKYRKPDQPSKVHISAEQKGAEWVISPGDNGIGFDVVHNNASTSCAFKHTRLHTAEEYPGTRVGLAICRHIGQGLKGAASDG